MKLIFAIFSFLLISSFSYAKDTCIKNDKGIFCGTEVIVQEKNLLTSTDRSWECIEFNGKKICGYDCKKSVFGADCKKEKDETCISNIKGVICGYNCKDNGINASACASKTYYYCIQKFGKVKCGTGCDTKYGKFECDEDDPNAKYLK